MSNLTQFSPFSGSGSSSGSSVPKILPLISSTSLNAFGSLSVSTNNYGRASQLSANQFLTSGLFASNSTGLIYIRAVPFQVSEAGVVTVGTASQTSNVSGTSLSTTIVGETYPGEVMYASYMYYNGSYTLSTLNARVDSSNVVSTYVTNQGAPSTIGYVANFSPFGTSASTAGTRYAIIPVYNSSSYATYTYVSSTGGAFGSPVLTSATGTYSSTSTGVPAVQPYSNTSSRCGLILTHDSSTTGFNVRELYNGTTASSSLGTSTSLFKTEYANYNVLGLRLPSGNSCYFNPANGTAITTNSTGTLLASNKTLNISTQANTSSYGMPYRTFRALSSNVFYTTSGDYNCMNIFKVTEDISTYNHTLTALDSFLINRGTMSTPNVQPPTYDDCYFFAGASNQFLVMVTQGYVNLFDATSLTLS